jgi:hypothetical protein
MYGMQMTVYTPIIDLRIFESVLLFFENYVPSFGHKYRSRFSIFSFTSKACIEQ